MRKVFYFFRFLAIHVKFIRYGMIDPIKCWKLAEEKMVCEGRRKP